MAKRVVPSSLNFTDIKPEIIENDIKLVKFIPTATINGVKGGDLLKLMISGNGFYDPYSAFFKFTVTCDDIPAESGECRFLDRSAHSFINKLVVRSNGVELERIEQYDVVAAMINDMIYSPEQNALHAWEGFPAQELQLPNEMLAGTSGMTVPTTGIQRLKQTVAVPVISNGMGVAVANTVAGSLVMGTSFLSAGIPVRGMVTSLLGDGSTPIIKKGLGEVCFGSSCVSTGETCINAAVRNGRDPATMIAIEPEGALPGHNVPFAGAGINRAAAYGNHIVEVLADSPFIQEFHTMNEDPNMNVTHRPVDFAAMYANTDSNIPVDFTGHVNGLRRVGTGANAENVRNIRHTRSTTKTFIIPIYSGVLGLLMPEKKYLPLNLLPLDIEISFNQHALYSSGNQAQLALPQTGNSASISAVDGSRGYKIVDFALHANVSYYEADIHRALEVAVAEHGIFLYCNSFHAVPVQLMTQNVPSTVYISMNLKSINSVHWVFMGTKHEQYANARKLHFLSHNLKSMQVRNGATLIPQYAVEGHSGTSIDLTGSGNTYVPFLVETLKAWNKLHDPATDGIIQAYNYCSDSSDGQADPIHTHPDFLNSATGGMDTLLKLVNKQALVGRCQYAVSLEGEELGEQKTMITGRKSEMPFLLQLSSHGLAQPTKASYILPFLRADFIIYIRPDLQITTLGK